MTAGGINSILATVSQGIQQAQARSIQAVQSLSAGDAGAPEDSVEFSDAANAASVESVAAVATTFQDSLLRTKALVLVARAAEKQYQATLDILA